MHPFGHGISFRKGIIGNYMFFHFRHRGDTEMLLIIKYKIFIRLVCNNHEIIIQRNISQYT